MPGPVKVLFLCTRNSCRSQMAEGWARQLHPGRLEAVSAGTRPGILDARAVRVMAEAGVDISTQRPKHLSEFADAPLDCAVTVCDAARESCPVFPRRVRQLHESFEDPPRLAQAAGSEEEALAIYRRVRDQIHDYVEKLPVLLGDAEG